jgi:hypothetical protein
MRGIRDWISEIEQQPFFFLLAAILLQIVVAPWVGDSAEPSLGLNIVYSLILASGLWAASGSRSGLWVGLTIATPALVLRWSAYAYPSLEGAALIAGLVFVAFVSWQVLKAAARAKRVHADTVFAGLCVYLLAGVGWTYAYGLAQLADPGALTSPTAGVLGIDDLLYFSFVTLTTLGYGDITPVSPAARTAVTLQSIFGQLFVAVFIARLVSLASRHDPDA